MKKTGSLVVVGSGIKSVGHLTLETQGWITRSDITIYCVADPATEVWIKKNSRSYFDLYTLYGNDKKRIDTYNDMTQVMIDSVRSGRDTCAVFYGHPGVFVLPTHKAISILRSEGYAAVMLPAISALDCLWADLGVDPSTVGSQSFEATDLLLRERTVLSDGHVVIWQIGCIGDLGFNFAGYDCRNLDLLTEYLERFYPSSHPVTHYQGAQYPVCPPSIETFPLGELPNAVVTGISTLYIPPHRKLPTSRPMGIRLGLIKPTPEEEANLHATLALAAPALAEVVRAAPAAADGPAPKGSKAAGGAGGASAAAAPRVASKPKPAAGPEAPKPAPVASRSPNSGEDALARASHERERMLEVIRSRRVSPISQYLHTPSENGLADYIAEMMTDPGVLAHFLSDPEQATAERLDLTPHQRRALVSQHGGRIRMAMKESPGASGESGVQAPPGAAAAR